MAERTPQSGSWRAAALRTPAVFIVEALLHWAPSLWNSLPGALLLLLGALTATIIMVLTKEELLEVLKISSVLLLLTTAVLVNYYAFWHLLPHKGLWMVVSALQLPFGFGYVTLLNVPSVYSPLIVLVFLIPSGGAIFDVSFGNRRVLVLTSAFILTLHLSAVLLSKMKSYYATALVYYSVVLHTVDMDHLYGDYWIMDLEREDWVQREEDAIPDVLRVFWITRLTVQAVVLTCLLKMAENDPNVKFYMISWESVGEVLSRLMVSGCDSTLTILGLSAVISSVAHHLELGVSTFIGSTDEVETCGITVPIVFFISALQTGLSGLKPEDRLVRLGHNMWQLLPVVLYPIQNKTDAVLLSLSASRVSFRSHVPALLVSACVLVLPVGLSYTLCHHYVLKAWAVVAVIACCVELCQKVIISVAVYVIFFLHLQYNMLTDIIDDVVYYVRLMGTIIEFLIGLIILGIDSYLVVFETRGVIRACRMCLHTLFNLCPRAVEGWKGFMKHWSAAGKIDLLPEVKGEELNQIDNVCAICFQQFTTSARVTPCRHYFHALCLQKWLQIQNTCPLCHHKVHIEETPVPEPAEDEEAREGNAEVFFMVLQALAGELRWAFPAPE